MNAYPDETFRGTVSQVRKSPTTTQNVVTYETIVTLENPYQKLFPGMTADVSILVSRKENVLEVANAALRYSPPVGAKFEKTPPKEFGRNQRLIYLLDRKSSIFMPMLVRAGITDGVETEIAEGLQGDEQVVTATLSFKEKAESGFPPKRPLETPP